MDSFPDSPISLWLDIYGEYTPEPPLEGELRVISPSLAGDFRVGDGL